MINIQNMHTANWGIHLKVCFILISNINSSTNVEIYILYSI